MNTETILCRTLERGAKNGSRFRTALADVCHNIKEEQEHQLGHAIAEAERRLDQAINCLIKDQLPITKANLSRELAKVTALPPPERESMRRALRKLGKVSRQ